MGTDTTVVRVRDVSKRFVIRKEKSLKERIVNAGRSKRHKDDFWALRDIDFEISSGSTVGLIGANGSGKSTLLKLIGGIIQPTSGTVTRRGRLAALIELGAGFHPDLTGRENVYLNCAILGLSREQTRQHFDSIVEFSGIEPFIDTQVKFYSSGMYIRLAFSVAVHVDPDVLLVDEVLAVGDEPFQRKCIDRIRSFQAEGRTIVLVSHALDQVAELCDRAIVLEHGNMRVDGEPLDALRFLRADFEVTMQEDRQRERQSELSHVTAEGRVVSVMLCDGDGQPLSALKPGDPMTVHITVRAASRLDNWILGFGIETSLGTSVYGTNTRMLNIAMPSLSGERAFQIELPQVWLGEGSYTVHGAIAEQSGAEIDRIKEAASFTVEADGRGQGTLYVAPEVVIND
jgi:homopolymeric O-antigen transport system ATP-binding protein